jgi:hypothetical protein
MIAWIIPGIPHSIVNKILTTTFLTSQSVANPTAKNGIKKHKMYNKTIESLEPELASFDVLLLIL